MATMEAANPAGASSVKGTNVQVAVRCRPLNGEERKAAQPCVVACDSEAKSIKVSYGPAGKKIQKAFSFDKVFGMYSTQEEVFDQMVRPIVDETLAGFNCTIFAYGQTGTGKTHTMEGDIHSEENAGIVPRSVKAILEQLESSGAEFTIRVSFLELYNEELQDLLAKPSDEKKLKLCEDVKKGVVCQNLEEITVLNVSDIFEILQRGIQQRQTAETLCNKNSSRSHSIFTMKIMIKECNVDGEEVVRHGQLNLVDLAGSECVGRSGAKSDRAREAGSINQSLLTLGRVITALVDHHGHIPYRDSKLTRLLQESLGGKAKTCIIATLSPSQLAMEESMSTLDYAYRAKNIKNQPTVNQKSTKKVILKEYCAEIESLKTQLQLTREKNGVYVDPAEFYAMEQRLATQENQIQECEIALRVKGEEVKTLRSDRDALNADLEVAQQSLQSVEAQLEMVSQCYEETKTTLKATELELKATEAVVGEQTSTESLLHHQGRGLQVEVARRREDVDGFLAKVDRFAANETKRMDHAAKFVAALHRAKADLETDAANFSSVSATQSDYLQQGVVDMLTRGRSTCSTLRSAIDSALTTLLGDAAIAKDAMTASCDHLNNHLHTTQDHIAQTLQNLQAQLSGWLGEVDASMQAAQILVTEQQTQIKSLASCVAEKAKVAVDLTEAFAAQQKQQSDIAISQSEQLRMEMFECISAFQYEHEKQLVASSELLESQAIAMESAMKSMIQDMLTSSKAAMLSSVSATTAFNVRSRDIAFAGADKSKKCVMELNSQASAFTSKALAHQSATESDLNSHIACVQLSGSNALQTLTSISGSVPVKKEMLDSTVTKLVGETNSALEEGCAVTKETSATANTILRDVTTATQRMNSSTGEAIESFTAFLDVKGNAISNDLGAHFASLDDHFKGQKQALDVLNGDVTRYGEEVIESALQPTGKTPKKTSPFLPLEALAKTRNHAEIKAQAISGEPPLTAAPVQQTLAIDLAAEEFVCQGSTAPVSPTPSTNACQSVDDNDCGIADQVDVPAVPVVGAPALDCENGDPNQVSSKLPRRTNSSKSTKSSKTEVEGESIPTKTRSTRAASSKAVC